ncbi:hypothetical protein ACQKOH_18130 [Sphingomonas sp. NPDC092331]|jgi:hypothetical protein
MANRLQIPAEQHPKLTTRRRPDVDRAEVRALIKERYKNTLTYLGK